jgi:hypothetical protein
VVRETGSEECQEKSKEHGRALQFHKHVQIELSVIRRVSDTSSVPENPEPASQNIVKSKQGTQEVKQPVSPVISEIVVLKSEIDNSTARRTIRTSWQSAPFN